MGLEQPFGFGQVLGFQGIDDLQMLLCTGFEGIRHDVGLELAQLDPF